MDVGGSWKPKMEPKRAPYGRQDGFKIAQEPILKGFYVRRSREAIRRRGPHWATRVETPKLGPWEEGREEGKPSPHIVLSYNFNS